METVYEVVGIQRGETKKGTRYTKLHVISVFDKYESDNGAVGRKAENVYIGENLSVEVGNKCNLIYGVGYGGKAVVKGIRVIK